MQVGVLVLMVVIALIAGFRAVALTLLEAVGFLLIGALVIGAVATIPTACTPTPYHICPQGNTR